MSDVQLGQISDPHTWFLDKDPGGYDNHVSNLHQHFVSGQMQILLSMLSGLTILMSMIYHNLESGEDHVKWLSENGVMLQ